VKREGERRGSLTKEKTRPNNVRGGVGLCVCVGECLKRRYNTKTKKSTQAKNQKINKPFILKEIFKPLWGVS
jgi:hypothetical protein